MIIFVAEDFNHGVQMFLYNFLQSKNGNKKTGKVDLLAHSDWGSTARELGQKTYHINDRSLNS